MEDNQTPAEGEELITEVTSVAQEEERTGVKIETPTADELATRAGASFIRNRRLFHEKFLELSSRGKVRVMNSVLDLPADGVPVFLKSKEEKVAFAIGQRLIADRFMITQHYISLEAKKRHAAAEEKKNEEKPLDKEDDKS